MAKKFPTILRRRYSNEESDRIDLEREIKKLQNELARNWNDGFTNKLTGKYSTNKPMNKEYTKKDDDLRRAIKSNSVELERKKR